MQQTKTLHEKVLDWLIENLPENTEYKKETTIFPPTDLSETYISDHLWRLIPDIQINQKEIIEVETTQIKKERYAGLPFYKIVYIVVDKEDINPFDEAIIAVWDKSKLVRLTSVKDETHYDSLKVELSVLENQVKEAQKYLETYEPKALRNLRNEEIRLKTEIETLAKQKTMMKGLSMLGSTEKKPMECKYCPFFSSWLREACKKEFPNLKFNLYEDEEEA